MRVLDDVFVLLHIKISHISIIGIAARPLLTAVFVFLLLFGCFQLFLSSRDPFDTVGFAESLLYVFVVAYSFLFWIKAWPKADVLLAKAGDIDKYSTNSPKKV